MEITFPAGKLKFSVIKGGYGQNAVVSNIADRNLTDLGLTVGLRIVEVNNTNVQGWKCKNIVKKIQQQSKPFCIVFKKVTFTLHVD